MRWPPSRPTPVQSGSTIEPLESRFCPAGLIVENRHGNLLISGDPSADLDVVQIGATKWQITDGDELIGKFRCRRSLLIELGDGDDQVHVQLRAEGIAGRLLIDLGDGVNSLALSATESSKVKTSLTVIGGAGVDDFTLGDTAPGLRIGTTFQVTDAGGGGTGAIGNLNVLGASTILALDHLTFGGTTLHKLVVGMVSAAIQNEITFDPATRILGPATILGAAGDDLLIADARFTGPVVINLGDGANETTAHNGRFGSSLQYEGGAGGDAVRLLGTSSIAGEVRLTLRDGENQVESYSGASFNRTVTIVAGNGADNLILGGTVRGNLAVALGSGANTTNFAGVVRGDSLQYFGGSDTDLVAYTEVARTASVRIDLGAGDDRLTLASNAFATATFTGGDGTDECVQQVPILEAGVTLTGFESITTEF